MILNMNQLRAFYTAARLKSVTLAARELMVTPPAISMQVKQLEETLEIKLMYRHGNTIRLTDVGLSVYKKTAAIFEKIHKLENYVEDISTGKSGVLRIGCPQTPAKYIMPGLIARFKKVYPGIRIVLTQGHNADMIKNLMTHKDELAFVRHRLEEKRIKIKEIGSQEVVLTAASESTHIPGKEISITKMPAVPLIVPKKGSGMRDVIFEYFSRLKVEPNIVMESGSIDFIKDMIRQDNGVCLLEKFAVEKELEEGTLKIVRIIEGNPVIQFGIGYLQRKLLSPSAWAFLRMLSRNDGLFPETGKPPASADDFQHI